MSPNRLSPNRLNSNLKKAIIIKKKKDIKDLINVEQNIKGLKYRLTDRPIFKHELKETDKKVIRAEFIGNPEKLEHILRISKQTEPSALPIKTP